VKCPHCQGTIGFFSKTMNSFGKKKRCPHCNKKIKVKPNWKILFLILPLVFVFHLFVFKPAVILAGFSGSGITGVSGAIAVLLSLRIYSDENEESLHNKKSLSTAEKRGDKL